MPTKNHWNGDEGFTLLEVLIALGLVAACITGVASLVEMSFKAMGGARDATVATLLAQQKLAALRSAPAGDPVLSFTSANALEANVAGHFDLLDSTGRPFGAAGAAPHSGPYLRRWRITAAPGGDAGVLVLSVRVLVSAAPDLSPASAASETTLSALRVVR